MISKRAKLVRMRRLNIDPNFIGGPCPFFGKPIERYEDETTQVRIDAVTSQLFNRQLVEAVNRASRMRMIAFSRHGCYGSSLSRGRFKTGSFP